MIDSKIKNYLCALISAGLLALTFPQFNLWFLAWGGLVPLLIALDHQDLKAAFGCAYLNGFIFFFSVFSWLTHVTILGTILLSLYSAIYFGLFGLSYSYFQKRRFFVRLFLLPSVWVVLEFIRTHFLSGFGWASLGESQYKFLPFIQIVDITGIYGLSFILVMSNVLLKEMISVRSIKTLQREVGLVCLMILAVLGYGWARLHQPPPESPGLKVAVIQASVPQELKWVESTWPTIFKDHQTLTELAMQENPQFIIWPETSFPGFLGEDEDLFKDLQDLVKRIHIPLLFGAVVKDGPQYYNSAVLLSQEGQILKRYDKIHLVPFGEFIPFRNTFPILQFVAPIADFSAGKEYTVFPSPFTGSFSIVICFEDTIAHVTRQFVNKGAQLLINITNDAWFKESSEPFMHLQLSVFRAIENRRDLVRAANTGISCFIDRFGHIKKYVQNQDGKKTFIIQYAIDTVSFNSEKTFYTKFGDIFTILCFGCILLAVLKRGWA